LLDEFLPAGLLNHGIRLGGIRAVALLWFVREDIYR
jgi:hypothetical protein